MTTEAEAEAVVMQPQAKDHSSHWDPGEAGKRFPVDPRMLQYWPSDTEFRLLLSRAAREYIYVVLNHQVYGNLLQWPQEKEYIAHGKKEPQFLPHAMYAL